MMKIRLFILSLLLFTSPLAAQTAQDIFELSSQLSFKQLTLVHAAIKQDYYKSDVPDKALEYGAIQGMLKALNDPYSRFLTPQQALEMKVNLSGKSTETQLKTDVFFNKVGYIRLVQFGEDTSLALTKALMSFKNDRIKAVVLDLRDNGGGLFAQAVEAAGVFIPNLPAVQIMMKNGKALTEKANGQGGFENMTLVVLVNNKTASSAEILTGALKDNKRAMIVGQTTYGKNTIQKVIDLPDGSAVLLTVGRYLTPNGLDISQKGISVEKTLSGPPTQQLQQAAELALLESYKKK
jgi:C-terminal processing protease CtpA/Prc